MYAAVIDDVFLFGDFRLDRCGGGLFRLNTDGDWNPVGLGSRALDVLSVLVQRAGDLVSKQQIMDAVWPGTAVEENNLTVQISALRRVLDEGRAQGNCIQTVPGRGYRFVIRFGTMGTVARFGRARRFRTAQCRPSRAGHTLSRPARDVVHCGPRPWQASAWPSALSWCSRAPTSWGPARAIGRGFPSSCCRSKTYLAIRTTIISPSGIAESRNPLP